MERQIFSITQINEYIRNVMDNDPLLIQIAVRGEISNYKMYPSGHHYFTLKDENASLKCVLFRGNAVRLRFKPENGMKVIALGKISVYPRDGAYQLVCTGLTVDGVGDLHAAFEQLKTKLGNMGLFSEEHKKPIPKYPGIIGIITSEAGAAVHDMLRILNARFPLSAVRLLPVRVQGVEAPGEIAAAIRYANHYHLADVLIVGRGGGSIEDLWAFNDEKVAFAIYESVIPVISAVGHEPDVTISDYVADLRAATPSNAAELAVPSKEALYQNLDAVGAALSTALMRQIKMSRQRLRILSDSAVMNNPLGYMEQRKRSIDALQNRLTAAQDRKVSLERRRYVAAVAKLDALSPLKVLSRGYGIVKTYDGVLVRSVESVRVGDNLDILLSDGLIKTNVQSIEESKK